MYMHMYLLKQFCVCLIATWMLETECTNSNCTEGHVDGVMTQMATKWHQCWHCSYKIIARGNAGTTGTVYEVSKLWHKFGGYESI